MEAHQSQENVAPDIHNEPAGPPQKVPRDKARKDPQLAAEAKEKNSYGKHPSRDKLVTTS